MPVNTTRGFTGHEHIDAANIVHMNGRLYDPALGRMLSADPIVQEPLNAQNLNRYTYVLNNPLSFTDPTGLSFFSKYWRTIVSVALTTFVPALAPLAWSNLAVAAATGFVAGVITSGTLTGGLFGAFSAVLFYGIGQHFDTLASQSGGFFGSGLSTGQFAGKVLSHALAGGIMNRLQGGKFGDGFASAGVTQALSPAIGKVNSSNKGFSPQRVVVAAMVGGTASAVSGGKFANGAVTAAFSRAFNDEATKVAKKRAFDELQERAFAIVDRVRDSFFADKSRPVNIEWSDFQTVVQADFELAGSLGLKDMSDEEFGPFASEGTGDSRFGHSALFGAKYNIVNAPAPFSGVQNGSDVNYYYQGIIWAAHGATIGTLHRAIEAHNLLDAATAGSWSERFRNVNQINSVKPFADWGYNYRGGK